MNLFRKLRNKDLSNKGQIFVWTLFDFANTSFSIVVVTFLYAVYFKDVIAKGLPEGDLYWSIATSLSMIITAMISPVMGAISDFSAGKKRFLLFFTIMCIISTCFLFFLKRGDIIEGILLFTLANIGFEAGLVFYDSFLPEITQEKNYGRVSGYGFGMGYLGSLVTLGLCFPFISNNQIKETFILAAIFFLVFSLPLFFFLNDSRKFVGEKVNYLKVGFSRVSFTITHLKRYKNLALFLLAFFFYIEGVNTVIFFSGNYASTTLNFSLQDLIIFFIIVQSTAILGSILFGIISDTTGQKKALVFSLLIWIATMIFAYFTSKPDNFLVRKISEFFSTNNDESMKIAFYMVGLLAGSVMGATQSTSRSLMSKLTPMDKKTEFFGFYSLFGKSSAVLGPLAFGLVSYLTGNQRYSILSICIFFVIGLFILRFVQDPSSEQET